MNPARFAAQAADADRACCQNTGPRAKLMMLLISLVMALVPLLGIAWILLGGTPFTVDGLFMSLILLAISAAFGGNALLELRRRKSPRPAGRLVPATRRSPLTASVDGLKRGRVEQVEFFESPVGQPNKSVVVLDGGGDSAYTVVLDGDVRNALPRGRKVEIAFRKEAGRNVLVDVRYP